jgi:hypothetical protein
MTKGKNPLRGKLFTLKAAAALCGVPVATFCSWLYRYRDVLEPPIYRKRSTLPRHRRLRPLRYLRPGEFERLVGRVLRRRIELELHPRGTRGQFLYRQPPKRRR